MKNKYLLLCLFSFFMQGQITTIQWQKIYNRPDNYLAEDILSNILQTTDGGYIMSGHSNSSNTTAATDFFIIKTDALGNVQWQKIIGGDELDYFPTIKQTTDGGFIVGGSSLSNISGQKTDNSKGSVDYWVLKLDSLGNIMWQKTIGGGSPDYLETVEQTIDGGYILGGYSESNIGGDKTEHRIGYEPNVYSGYADYWVVKINSIGDIQWQNTIGGNNAEFGGYTTQTLDGGYIVSGTSYSWASGNKTEENMGQNDIWIVKLSNTGVIEWENTLGGNNQDRCNHEVIKCSDGGYIVGGSTNSLLSGDVTEAPTNTNYSGWVFKLNAQGNILWQNRIGSNISETLDTMSQTTDGGYILGLSSVSNIFGDKSEVCRGMRDYWLVKINANGTVLWDKTIGGSDKDTFSSLIQTSDGGYMAAGHSQSPISGEKTSDSYEARDYWLVKLSQENLLASSFTVFNAQLYPNPTKNTFTINFSQSYENLAISIVTTLGQIVQEKTFSNSSEINLEINGSAGLYFVNVVNESGEKVFFKVVKE